MDGQPITRGTVVDIERCRQGGGTQAETRPVLRVTSRDLLQERTELIIVHEGREYRLRITQNGKLILTA